MYSVNTISSYFINKANSIEIDEGIYEGISHLKLQKILYFTQATFLAVGGKPAFNEDILAWEYGPVVKEIYEEYSKKREMGNSLIPTAFILDDNFSQKITQKDNKILSEVWEEFGKYSANRLVKITHSHKPWKEAYSRLEEMGGKSSGNTVIITNDSIKEYYEGLIEID